MAATGLHIDHIDRETFCCSICLDLLKDPVTIPCGHSYCMSCVNTHWDGAGKSYSCPQCRQNFTQRPVLVKNTMLSILMEGLRQSGPPASPVSPSSPAQGDVSCDLCSGRKVKAVKSCLQCLVSYCKEHLQPHYDVAALKKHKLVEPKENLQENICPRHDEVMKMFCRTDQQCICYLCSVDQHKGHDTVTAAAERAEKQRALQAVQQNLLQRIHHKETDEERLQQQMKNSSHSADAAVEQSDRSLKELLRLLEERLSEVKEQVRSQQEAEELRVKELQDKVQQEITELKKKLTELDTLSLSEDHVHFLHKFASLSKVSESSDSVNSSRTPRPFQDTVRVVVSKLRSALQETSLMDPPAEVHKPKVKTPKTAPETSQRHTVCMVSPPPQSNCRYTMFPSPDIAPLSPQSSEEWPALQGHNLNDPQPSLSNYWKLKKYIGKITWDERSMNERLELLSDDQVIHVHCRQNLRPHSFRFTKLPQVMSRETLRRPIYFEFFTPYEHVFTIAVSYMDIRRDGSSDECSFGMNDKSWALQCLPDHSVFWHNGNKVEIPIKGNLAGVFVDFKAGVVSFYRQLCKLELIYTVKTKFIRPLLAGLRLDDTGMGLRQCKRMFLDIRTYD